LSDILSLSLAELAEQFRSRALSPVELLEAVLVRAEAVQLRLNAFRMIDAERAREAARASEQRWGRQTYLSRSMVCQLRSKTITYWRGRS
jgi:aspartyl-tRNA(Asn)/glutamyl-tRNA(Gln) amidotransferase subunit A